MASHDQQPVIGQYMYVPSPSANPTKTVEPTISVPSVPKIVTNGKITKIREAMVREATISPLSPEEYDSNLEYMLTIDLSPKLPSKEAQVTPKVTSKLPKVASKVTAKGSKVTRTKSTLS